MTVSKMSLSAVFNRISFASCIVAPLTAGALLAAFDGALARGSGGNASHGSSSVSQAHIATLPTKMPIGHPIIVNGGPKPVVGMKHEHRREALLRKIERCIEYGRCHGVVIQPVGTPKPLPPQPVGLPVGGPKPLPPGPGMPGGSGGTGAGSGSSGGSAGGGTSGTPVNVPPTKPPVLTDPGYGAPSKSGGGGSGGGGGSTIENGGTPIKQF